MAPICSGIWGRWAPLSYFELHPSWYLLPYLALHPSWYLLRTSYMRDAHISFCCIANWLAGVAHVTEGHHACYILSRLLPLTSRLSATPLRVAPVDALRHPCPSSYSPRQTLMAPEH